MAGILIFGYGNTLRGDDGLGPEAVSHLKERLASDQRGIQFRIAHQLLPEDTGIISEVDHVIFIDAREGESPGEIQSERLYPSEEGLEGTSFHTITPATLLTMAEECFGSAPTGHLFTITGKDFGYQEGLSRVIEDSLPQLTEQVLDHLAMVSGSVFAA